LEIFDICIDETRNFFIQLKKYIFKENQLELDQEVEQILTLLFSDFQKLYHQKELTYLDKTSQQFYAKLLDKIKQASLQAQDQETKSTIQWFMNKPKLIQMFKTLDQKGDGLSA
jgi:hypothetical protein